MYTLRNFAKTSARWATRPWLWSKAASRPHSTC